MYHNDLDNEGGFQIHELEEQIRILESEKAGFIHARDAVNRWVGEETYPHLDYPNHWTLLKQDDPKSREYVPGPRVKGKAEIEAETKVKLEKERARKREKEIERAAAKVENAEAMAEAKAKKAKVKELTRAKNKLELEKAKTERARERDRLWAASGDVQYRPRDNNGRYLPM
jgi:hypothetical protein